MVQNTPKGNKTCVQHVKYLSKNGDKMRTNNDDDTCHNTFGHCKTWDIVVNNK